MANKKEKKNALKKMLNEKTLLEMSGGGDLPNTYDNIPGTVKLANTKTVSEILSQIGGFSTTDTEFRKALGASEFSSKLARLDNTTYNDINKNPIIELLGDTNRPYKQEELANKNVSGIPLYIADQIQKSTGVNDPLLPTGMVVDASPGEKGLFDSSATHPHKLNYIQDADKKDLKDLRNNGVNRYLTLYDLITDDDGKFLSPDVDLILNRFSSLAQFKHLPALEYLASGVMSGGAQSSQYTSKSQQSGGKQKNRSRKIRK